MNKSKGIVKKEIINDIISMIIQGTLNEGDLLPSIRNMSAHYQVSRGTILVVYKYLESIGYIQGFERSGYVVLKTKEPISPRPLLSQDEFGPLTIDHSPHSYHEKLAKLIERNPCRLPVHFIKRWIINYEKNYFSRSTLGSLSHLPRFLKLSRRLEVAAHSLLLFPGFQEALTLIALFLKRDTRRRVVLIEEPCSPNIKELFIKFNFEIISITVDHHGLRVEQLPDIPHATLVCMPTLQYPTATQLSVSRKEKLYHWAVSNQAIIVEDDRFAMLGFGKNLSTPLFLDFTDVPVFYLTHLFELTGTTYNLAMLVLPEPFNEACHTLHRVMTSTYPPTSFYVVEDFISSSYFMKYLTALIEERRHKATLAHQICFQHFRFDLINFHHEAGFCYFSASQKDLPNALINEFFFPISPLPEPLSAKHEFLFPYALLTITELKKIICQENVSLG